MLCYWSSRVSSFSLKSLPSCQECQIPFLSVISSKNKDKEINFYTPSQRFMTLTMTQKCCCELWLVNDLLMSLHWRICCEVNHQCTPEGNTGSGKRNKDLSSAQPPVKQQLCLQLPNWEGWTKYCELLWIKYQSYIISRALSSWTKVKTVKTMSLKGYLERKSMLTPAPSEMFCRKRSGFQFDLMMK